MAKKIRQHVSAGSNFDGTAPTKSPVVDNGTLVTYAEEDAGGEFTPGKGTLRTILLRAGSQSSAEFKVVFGKGGEQQLLACPFPDRQVRWAGELFLTKNDKIVVTTKNASESMMCDVTIL